VLLLPAWQPASFFILFKKLLSWADSAGFAGV